MIILLAEDDVGLRLFVWRLLRADGLSVLTASDGIAALEVSRNHPGTIEGFTASNLAGAPRTPGNSALCDWPGVICVAVVQLPDTRRSTGVERTQARFKVSRRRGGRYV